MLINTNRIENFIENRGVTRNLSVEDWASLISLVSNKVDGDICYSFCLLPQTTVPQKERLSGFPSRIIQNLQYLNILELILIDPDERLPVTNFLDSRKCPWEEVLQFDPDSGIDEPIGIRVHGFSFSTKLKN